MNNVNDNNFGILNNEKGMTIFELLVSIVIGTVVLSMLMQLLVMNISGRVLFETENKMLNESYSITERIRQRVFTLQPHSIDLDDTSDPNLITVTITHEYDIVLGVGNILERDYSNPVSIVIVYNKSAETLSIDGQLLHSSNIRIEAGSVLSLIRIDPAACLIDPALEICEQGILQLELTLSIELPGGGRLDPQTYTSTIII